MLNRLGELRELGHLSNRQVAALYGLVPFNRDSCQMKGKRRIEGGGAPIRTMFYIAMLCAIQHNPVMRQFYQSWSLRVSTKKWPLQHAGNR